MVSDEVFTSKRDVHFHCKNQCTHTQSIGRCVTPTLSMLPGGRSSLTHPSFFVLRQPFFALFFFFGGRLKSKADARAKSSSSRKTSLIIMKWIGRTARTSEWMRMSSCQPTKGEALRAVEWLFEIERRSRSECHCFQTKSNRQLNINSSTVADSTDSDCQRKLEDLPKSKEEGKGGFEVQSYSV